MKTLAPLCVCFCGLCVEAAAADAATTAPDSLGRNAAKSAPWPGFERGMGLGGWLTNYKRFNVLPDKWRFKVTQGDLEHFETFISEADVERSRERQPPPSRYGRLVTICAVNAAVFFLSGFCFHYNALDRLEAAGRISAANPVMLAACLVGFVLYGIVFLREKPSASQLAGTLLAVIGAILVAI